MIKILTCIACVVLMAIECSNIIQSYRFFKQEPFFREIKDYNYCDFIGYKGETENLPLVYEQYYRTYQNKMIMLDGILGVPNYEKVIVSTSQTLPWLNKWISDFHITDITGNVCLLIPNSYKRNKDSEEQLFLIGANYLPEDEILSTQVITYSDNANIIEINSDYYNYSEWINSPVILIIIPKQQFNQIDLSKIINNDIPPSLGSIRTYNIPIKVSKKELFDFANNHGYEASVTNVYSYYLYRKKVVKRTLYLNSIIAILVFILNILINNVIIRMEYQINMTELAVKKTLGFTNIERLKRLYILSFSSIALSSIISVIFLNSIIDAIIIPLLCTLTLFFISEVIIVYKIFKKYEKINLSIILKGGKI